MKTCNNCNTVNEVHLSRCVTCNMEGNFTLHAVATEALPIVEEEADKLHCSNCGSKESVELSKCSQCRFPLTLVSAKPISKLAHLNRKVG